MGYRGKLAERQQARLLRRTGLPLVEIAARHGVTPAQVVVRWHVDHQVVVIPKSATPERIAANFDVFGFSLTEEELARIDGLSGSRRR